MKRHLGKRLVGALLASILLLSCLPLAFAAQRKETPVIVVPGMGSALYQNAGTEGQREIWPIAFDDGFMDRLSPLLNNLLELLGNPNGDLSPLFDQVMPIAQKLLNPLACNPDGTSKDGTVDVGFHWLDSMANHMDYLTGTQGEPGITRALCDKIGPENVYLFMYDWRLDITDHARALHDLVEQVKTEKGVDRVSLVSGSMGTSIAAAYLDSYGASDLKNCVFLSPAFQGTSLGGELFQKKLVLDKQVVMRYFNQMELPPEMSDLIDNIDAMGLLDTVFSLLNRLIDEYKDQVYEQLLIPVFATMPGFWGVTAQEYYDGAIETLAVTDSTMLARIEACRSAQENLAENLKAAQAGGTYVAVVAHYGLFGVPVTSLPQAMSDNLIDTKYASGGAVCASVRGTLGADYVQQQEDGHLHLSADGQIDASACILPDTTWFLKGSGHMIYLYDTDSMNLVVWLITADDAPTVFTEKAYPQFLQFHADGALTPVVKDLKPEPPVATTTAPDTAAQPSTQDETSETPRAKEDQSPATGDNPSYGLAALLAITMGTLTVLLKKKK